MVSPSWFMMARKSTRKLQSSSLKPTNISAVVAMAARTTPGMWSL